MIDSGNDRLWRKALVRRLYGFRHCKVKVGHAGDDDVARLRTIRRWIGPTNGPADRCERSLAGGRAARKARTAHGVRNLSCVEQPVPHGEVSCLAELRSQVAVPIMLDESLTSMIDARGGHRRARPAICSTFACRSAAASWPACAWRRWPTPPAWAINSAAIRARRASCRRPAGIGRARWQTSAMSKARTIGICSAVC